MEIEIFKISVAMNPIKAFVPKRRGEVFSAGVGLGKGTTLVVPSEITPDYFFLFCACFGVFGFRKRLTSTAEAAPI